nr:MAG TPA: hypothetical protein [Caudoviricetes sp.]
MAIDENSQIANVGAIGNQGAQQMEVAYAAKMAAVLTQPMGDMTTKLVNEDFAGDFFKIGDSVSITKPDVNSVKFEFGEINTGKILAGNTADVGTNGAAKDARIKGTYAAFTKNILTIDKYAKYAFAVSRLTKAEERWNEASGNLALEAHNLRTGHNLLTANMIVNDTTVGRIGTPTAPIELATADELFTKVIIPAKTKLRVAGAITSDGHITYGSNPQQGVNDRATVFVPDNAYNLLLTSEYFTRARGTDLADKRVEGKSIDRVLGMDLEIEACLDPNNADLEHKVTITGAAEGVMAVVIGTKNLVTRASKVLPPDTFVSHDRYADEYHGLEIYGEKLVEPKAGVVAFIKLPA